MKKLTCIVVSVVVGLFVVGITPVLAFDCPTTHKTLVGYYEKTTKVQGADQAKLAQAKKLLDDAMKDHEAGKHKDSMKEMADAMVLINASRP
jgi:hypothetical protein